MASALIPPGGNCIGFDLGTSGARAVVVDGHTRTVQHMAELKWSHGSADSPEAWTSAVDSLLSQVPQDLLQRTHRICVSGTSASCLLVDSNSPLKVTRRPAMYNHNVLLERGNAGQSAYSILTNVAPPLHTTLSGTSALMKLLTWAEESPLENELLAHQADYVSCYVRGGVGGIVSDWNNALKTGYDVETLRWPDWLLSISTTNQITPISECLPPVVRPGDLVGPIGTDISGRYNIPRECMVAAGTTDSIAAFLAANVEGEGAAVTSLGSTMAIKMLSRKRVEDASRGVYSHRLGDSMWLVGGASNVGCAVFRQLGFSDEELASLSSTMDPNVISPYAHVYYPLAGNGGERFPYNDPNMKAVLEPVPASRGEYLQGLLQSLARIEAESFAVLKDLGASPVTSVATAGGGARNDVWTAMRQQKLGIPVKKAVNADAGYGVALLGLRVP